MGVRLGQRVAANQGMETPFALVIAHSPLRGRLGRQLAVNFSGSATVARKTCKSCGLWVARTPDLSDVNAAL